MSDVRWAVQGDQGRNVVHAITAGDSPRHRVGVGHVRLRGRAHPRRGDHRPADIDDADLADWAEQRRQAVRRPVTISCRIPADPYWTDRASVPVTGSPVTVIRGALRSVGVMRVQRLTLTADDQVELLLVPWPGGAM